MLRCTGNAAKREKELGQERGGGVKARSSKAEKQPLPAVLQKKRKLPKPQACVAQLAGSSLANSASTLGVRTKFKRLVSSFLSMSAG